jgi:primosomal protein N' (replication factor Y)
MVEARGEGAFLLFGSVSPSLETFHAAERGAITLIRPPISPKEQEVRIVSMNKEKEPLSAELLAAIARTLKQGKRVLLAVNRRGSFQAILCKQCGQPLRCPHCGGNLTYGVRSAQLICRICGTAQSRMVCPHCGSRALRFVGVGSARVEGEIKERFPSARVVRIDMDTLRTREQERVAERALRGEGEILVATPMVAKGPPLPRLGLVGAIGVDALLALPDFRAAERTYQ